MSSEWNFAPDVIVKAQEIGIGARVIAHWTEAEVQDQDGTVVGVEIHRYGKVGYTVHLDGGISPTNGFTHDPTGQKPGTISLSSDENPNVGRKVEAQPLHPLPMPQYHFQAETNALTNTDLSLRAENERLRKERDAMSATVQRLVGRGNALVGYLDNPEAIEAGAATAYNAWNHEAQSALTSAVENLKGAE